MSEQGNTPWVEVLQKPLLANPPKTIKTQEL
jgi:hypothetical protein